jgi:hypothetical protein
VPRNQNQRARAVAPRPALSILPGAEWSLRLGIEWNTARSCGQVWGDALNLEDGSAYELPSTDLCESNADALVVDLLRALAARCDSAY